MQHPSVLEPLPLTPSTPGHSYEGFESSPPEGSSPNRRQRISMACQYCRHRKIRCCGGSPCRNCKRFERECDYAPVTEEVNRTTRERKALKKAAKLSHFATPTSTYLPYFVDTPVLDLPDENTPICPIHVGGPQSVSVSSFDWVPWHHALTAPQLQSPVFESAHWMNADSPASLTPSVQHEPTSMFPPVLEQSPLHSAYLQGQLNMSTGYASPLNSRFPSAEVAAASTLWSAPPLQTYLRPPIRLTFASSPVTPVNSTIFSPFPSPTVFQSPSQPFPPALVMNINTSPSLAPEMPAPKMVGLGIGVPEVDVYQAPTFLLEEYFS